MNRPNFYRLLLSTGLLLLTVGCSQQITTGRSPAGREQVTPGARLPAPQPSRPQLHDLARAMADNLLHSAAVDGLEGKPLLYVATIADNSGAHVDTEAMTSTVKARLRRAGKFRFVAPSREKVLKSQLEYQRRSVNTAAMVRLGKQTGADYLLYGSLTRSQQRYRLSMALMELRSGELIWRHQVAGRPSSGSQSLGW